MPSPQAHQQCLANTAGIYSCETIRYNERNPREHPSAPSSGMTYQIASAIAALQIECLKSVAPIKSMDIHLALKLIGLIESIYLSADKATDSIFGALNVPFVMSPHEILGNAS